MLEPSNKTDDSKTKDDDDEEDKTSESENDSIMSQDIYLEPDSKYLVEFSQLVRNIEKEDE